jgi:hypothetical protein
MLIALDARGRVLGGGQASGRWSPSARISAPLDEDMGVGIGPLAGDADAVGTAASAVEAVSSERPVEREPSSWTWPSEVAYACCQRADRQRVTVLLQDEVSGDASLGGHRPDCAARREEQGCEGLEDLEAGSNRSLRRSPTR